MRPGFAFETADPVEYHKIKVRADFFGSGSNETQALSARPAKQCLGLANDLGGSKSILRQQLFRSAGLREGVVQSDETHGHWMLPSCRHRHDAAEPAVQEMFLSHDDPAGFARRS